MVEKTTNLGLQKMLYSCLKEKSDYPQFKVGLGVHMHQKCWHCQNWAVTFYFISKRLERNKMVSSPQWHKRFTLKFSLNNLFWTTVHWPSRPKDDLHLVWQKVAQRVEELPLPNFHTRQNKIAVSQFLQFLAISTKNWQWGKTVSQIGQQPSRVLAWQFWLLVSIWIYMGTI